MEETIYYEILYEAIIDQLNEDYKKTLKQAVGLTRFQRVKRNLVDGYCLGIKQAIELVTQVKLSYDIKYNEAAKVRKKQNLDHAFFNLIKKDIRINLDDCNISSFTPIDKNKMELILKWDKARKENKK